MYNHARKYTLDYLSTSLFCCIYHLYSIHTEFVYRIIESSWFGETLKILESSCNLTLALNYVPNHVYVRAVIRMTDTVQMWAAGRMYTSTLHVSF